MSNKDLFKQAIADAKSIREAAIANAKLALEETITPHVKEMLAEKLKAMEEAEMEEEANDMLAQGNQDVTEEGYEEEAEETMEEAKDEEAAEEAEEEGDAEGEESEEGADDSEESEEGAEEEMEVKDMEMEDLKDLIRDILSQELGEEPAEEEGEEMEAGEEGEDLVAGEPQPEDEIELEELMNELAELETEGTEEVTEEEVVAEEEVAEEVVAEEEVNEMTSAELVSQLPMIIGGITALIGGSLAAATWQDNALAGKYGKAMQSFAQKLTAAGSAASAVAQQTHTTPKNEELAEAMETIETLRNDLNETNLLNAKLLYVNKVFKANNLTESQKANVIATFDKAETVKEVKLVFESVSANITNTSKKEVVKESKGFASAAAGLSTKPEVITEANEVVKRMQKLAGIIK